MQPEKLIQQGILHPIIPANNISNSATLLKLPLNEIRSHIRAMDMFGTHAWSQYNEDGIQIYCKTLEVNKIVDHSDVVGACLEQKLWFIHVKHVINSGAQPVTGDGLALWRARTSADTVMTKFGSWLMTVSHINGLKQDCNIAIANTVLH